MPHNVLYDTPWGGAVKEAVTDFKKIVNGSYAQGNYAHGWGTEPRQTVS